MIHIESLQVLRLSAKVRIPLFGGKFIDAFHRRAKILRGNADLVCQILNRVGLECPAALHAFFPGLREFLQRNAGENDRVKRKEGTFVHHGVHLLLIEDRVHHAARGGHGVVDINKHGAAGLIEETFAFVVHPEPGLRERAASLLQIIRTAELTDRGIIGEVRSVAGNSLHAGKTRADQLRHVDAVARAAVLFRAAEPDRFHHARGRRVSHILRDHLLIRGETAGGDDDFLRHDKDGIALGALSLNADNLPVIREKLLRRGRGQNLCAVTRRADVLFVVVENRLAATLE